MNKFALVVPWHNEKQIETWKQAWNYRGQPWVVFQRDENKRGCAHTKNRGVIAAIDSGAEWIAILDDDCFPLNAQMSLEYFMQAHWEALQDIKAPLFQEVTSPPSRGTPYFNKHVLMEVAASMGFWEDVGDYDAPSQLVRGPRTPMQFFDGYIYARYFPLCGMNLAFKAKWWPWCQFIDVPRFDDIWQGFLWQKEAYARGCCFNLAGPRVKHSRQSNVWQNLRDESANLEKNEMIWQEIFRAPRTLTYEQLRGFLNL